MTKIRILTFLALLAIPAQAQFLVQGDENYWIQARGRVQFIYPLDQVGNLREITYYTEYFMQKYEKSFKWALDERLKMIVASEQNQIANGFATTSPLLQTAHYPAGTEILDIFAQDSFLQALASHETAHLYQLSVKSQLSTMVHSVLGNVMFVMTPLGFPIWVFPNALNPRFIVEGNAVLNESTAGVGGRLWSGEIRAEVLQQINAGALTPAELMNFDLNFPLSEDYHAGGYFAAHLGETYGMDKANRFFKSHAERDIWPFRLNKTFRLHFGTSYSRLIHDFTQKLAPVAQRHQSARGEVVAKIFNRPVFNHDDKKIYFVGNPTGRLANRFYSIDKITGVLEETKTALPDGKAFIIDGEKYAVTSSQVNPTNIKYGLFDESLHAKKGTLGEIFQDIRGGKQMSVDASASYSRNSALKDGEFFDFIGSSAILNDKGDAYYFRQAGAERVLYREKTPLFKFPGYYGFPLEVTANGDVYFIASTELGASLFRWNLSGVERMFPADNVVHARHLKDDVYLVAAITHNGYEIQKLKSTPVAQNPMMADWKFPNIEAPAPVLQEIQHEKSKEYGPLSQMRYSQANVLWGGGGQGSINVLFTDPLWWNALLVHYQKDAEEGYAGGIAYRNQRHRLGWLIEAEFDNDEKYISPITLQESSDVETTALIALNYQVFKSGRWSSDLLFGPLWTEDTSFPEDLERRAGVLGNLDFTYSRADSSLAYEPYRYFRLNYQHRTELDELLKRKTDSINGADVLLSGDVYRQTFLRGFGSWAVAETDSIDSDDLDFDLNSKWTNFHRAVTIPTFTGKGEVRELREWGFNLKQVVDYQILATRFPFSLLRFAPFVEFRDVYAIEETFSTTKFDGWHQQVKYGTEFDLLFIHFALVRGAIAFDTIEVGGEMEHGWNVAFKFSPNSF